MKTLDMPVTALLSLLSLARKGSAGDMGNKDQCETTIVTIEVSEKHARLLRRLLGAVLSQGGENLLAYRDWAEAYARVEYALRKHSGVQKALPDPVEPRKTCGNDG